MTSRVQKGGLVFKPVAKSRARSTAPSQASTPAEIRGAVPLEEDASAPTLPSMPPPSMPPPSMPPPASLPIRDLDLGVSRVADPSQPVASTLRTMPVVAASGSHIFAPPVIVESSRSVPAPPVIVTRATPAPNNTSSSLDPPSPTLVNSTTDGSVLHTSQPPSQEFRFPEDLSQLIAPSNPSTLVSTPDSPVKKRATRKRKKADTDGEATEGENTEKPKKARKKRAKKDAGETPDNAEPKPKKKRKAKAEDNVDEESTSPKKKRKKSKVPAFDPEADPGEEIDPTLITMAELCVDNGQGRISTKAVEIQKNHLAWKQQSRDKRARMKALAEQKKYGKKDEEDGEEIDTNAASAAEAPSAPDASQSAEIIVGPSEPSEAQPVIADATGSGFDYSQQLTASRFTVQVRLGPNGETIIDEESLTVDRTEEVDTSNYVHVVESDHTKFVNSQSYTKKMRGSRWSAEETDLFFDALAQHGENYELISLVLPGRSRTACKNKFKTEDKKDSARITRCLESRLPIDMKTLTRLTGRDFSGPVPIIKAPTPPPIPDPAEGESETPLIVRKRSRSRTAPATEGVQIIGDADTYDKSDL
ncbi:hypothetical protein DFH07DRAFT_532070 [Mycena maculata]|uniref:Myb-like domain-containing protein n=1 Tax=Mycena maculata TaxID=230809 RepID=A0AAD7IVE1_9AGAR|nr:hypothetical protein DFH07DRAFT_532070 [Mycena maculata]